MFILDSDATLALLDDEEGSDRVAEIIASEDAKIQMSIINLGEVYCMFWRRLGEKNAETVVGRSGTLPRQRLKV